MSLIIPHPPEYKHYLKGQSPKYEEITNENFWLSRIELINCIASCDTDVNSIDEKKIAEIEKKCIKSEHDRRILEDMIAGQQFSESLQFTEKERNILKKSRNSRLMVGAGIQREIDKSMGTEILESASDMERPTGLALISLIDRYLALLSNGKTELDIHTKLRKSILKMLQIEKHNALSYYLYASILQSDKNDTEAINQLKLGNSKSQFNSYSSERYLAVVEAAESVGYSKFTARHYAINFFAPDEIYSNLIDLCSSLVSKNKSEDSRKECLKMGEKIEISSSNTFEKMQGLMIQGVALRDSPDPKHAESLADVSKKQRRTLETGTRSLKIPFKAIPEDVWVQHHDLFFEKGKESAIKFIEAFYENQKKENMVK